MKIDCISDLHGDFPELEGGDLLIVAGDLTARDRIDELSRFKSWLSIQKYQKIVVVAGNHDGLIQKGLGIGPKSTWETKHLSYLQDSGTEFEGLKIWGSPWTPTFYDWHFMKERGEEIKKVWDLIPDDTDILITHGPPFGLRDRSMPGTDPCGCMDLLEAVARVRPKLHVFGHIHGGYGVEEALGTIYVNASIMDEGYKPVNKPIRIEL